MATSLTEFYKIKAGKKIRLKISTGFAQPGVTSVRLGSTELVRNQEGIVEIDLGIGDEVGRNTLFCTTTVTAMRDETLQTGVTFELTGGDADVTRDLQEPANTQGDVVFFTATFRFLT